MRTRLMIEKPAEVTLTLKVEATAAEFEALRNDLDRLVVYAGSFHPNETTKLFAGELTNLLAHVRKVIYPDGTYPKLLATMFSSPVYVESDAPDFVLDALLKRLKDKPKEPDIPRRPDGTPVGDGGPMER